MLQVMASETSGEPLQDELQLEKQLDAQYLFRNLYII